MTRRLLVGVALLLVMTVLRPTLAQATPSLDPSAYSWQVVFVEPQSIGIDASYPTPLRSPFTARVGWPPINLPFGQANDSATSPYRAFSVSVATGTVVCAVVAGEATIDRTHNTVVQQADHNSDGYPDIKVVYRNVVVDKNLADGFVDEGTKLGKVDQSSKLDLEVLHYYSHANGDASVRPYFFYRNATGWNFGKDVSFIKTVYRDLNSHRTTVSAYSIGSPGTPVAPAEFVIFHKKDGETAYRTTSLTNSGGQDWSCPRLSVKR